MKRYDPVYQHQNGPGWSWDSSAIKECSDGEYVRVEDVKQALFQVRQAQARLEDELPSRTELGKKYEVASACESLRKAHNILALLCEP